MTHSNGTRVAAGTLAALLLWSAAGSAGQSHTKKAVNLSGEWTLTTASEGPHGAVSMGLTLQQDAGKVRGTLVPPHGGEINLAGEVEDRTLTLADPSHEGLTMKATLQDDGTLSGYLSSERGDMTWTARRVNSKERR